MTIATSFLKKRQFQRGAFALPLFFLLFSLISCGTPKRCQEQKICSSSGHRAKRLLLSPATPIDGIALEVLSVDGKEELFLHHLLFAIRAPANSLISFSYEIDGNLYEGEARLFAGGQKLRLEGEEAKELLSALKGRKKILIRLGSFQTLVLPSCFC